MTPALILSRLTRAGMHITTIEKRCGFGRGKLVRVAEGITALSAEERHRLETFAAGFLPRGAMALPHHERVTPRYGR